SVSFKSSAEFGKSPSIRSNSSNCETIRPKNGTYVAQIPSIWLWSAKLTGVYNGIHRLTVKNPTSVDGNSSTNATDHFLIRIGQHDNPMIFTAANYSSSLLHQHENGTLYIQHHAAGADKYRYSTNWGTTFSDWLPYKGGNETIEEGKWS